MKTLDSSRSFSKKNFFNTIHIVLFLAILFIVNSFLYPLSLTTAVIINLLFIIYFLAYLFLINKYYTEKRLAIQKNKLLQNQMTTIIESMPELVCILDKESRLILINSRFSFKMPKILGVEPKLGMTLEELIIHLEPNIRNEILNNWQKIINGEEIIRIHQINHKSFEVSSNCIRNEENKIIGTIHLTRDISMRIKQEKKLEYLNHKLIKEMQQMNLHNKKMALLIELGDTLQACSTIDEVAKATASYGKKILDFSKGLLYTVSSNAPLELKSSWGQHEAFKQKPIDPEKCWAIKQRRAFLVLNPDKDLICEHLQHNKEYIKPYICIPLTINSKILGLIYLEFKALTIKEEQLHLISAVTESTTLALSNVKLREQLLDQSIHDSLTGLYNRRYLEEFLTQLIHQAKREQKTISLIMFDLDNFKMLNDQYGHEAGDAVLKEIATLFKSVTRSGDIACRWGGEEFIWLMPNTSVEHATKRTEELRNKIAHLPLQYGVRRLESITISCGIATFPEDAIAPSNLIDLADRALYVAKNRGRNQTVVYSRLASEIDSKTTYFWLNK